MPPGNFLQPRTEKLQAMMETHLLSSAAKVLLVWLLTAADPRDGRVPSLTQQELAERLSWNRKTVGDAVAVLAAAGVIEAWFPRGAAGWVRILAYHDIMQPSRWLARQRAIGRPVAP